MTKFGFQPFDKVLVRDGENQTWRADLYSHEDDTSWPFCCMAGSDWKFCIPYNETTKHLCGTSDPYIDPAEAPAFEFGDVVEFTFPRHVTRAGTFIKIRKDKPNLCHVAHKGGVAFNIPLEAVKFIRKGNFND